MSDKTSGLDAAVDAALAAQRQERVAAYAGLGRPLRKVPGPELHARYLAAMKAVCEKHSGDRHADIATLEEIDAEFMLRGVDAPALPKEIQAQLSARVDEAYRMYLDDPGVRESGDRQIDELMDGITPRSRS